MGRSARANLHRYQGPCQAGREKARDAEPRGDVCIVCRSTARHCRHLQTRQGPDAHRFEHLGAGSCRGGSVPGEPSRADALVHPTSNEGARRPAMPPTMCPSDAVALIRLVECAHCTETQIACVACPMSEVDAMSRSTAQHSTARLMREVSSWATGAHAKSPSAIWVMLMAAVASCELPCSTHRVGMGRAALPPWHFADN